MHAPACTQTFSPVGVGKMANNRGSFSLFCTFLFHEATFESFLPATTLPVLKALSFLPIRAQSKLLTETVSSPNSPNGSQTNNSRYR